MHKSDTSTRHRIGERPERVYGVSSPPTGSAFGAHNFTLSCADAERVITEGLLVLAQILTFFVRSSQV